MKKSILVLFLLVALAVSCTKKVVCPSYDSSGVKSPTDVMNSHKGRR